MTAFDFSPHIGTSATDFFQSDRDINNSLRRDRKRGIEGKLVGLPWGIGAKILSIVWDPEEEEVGYVGLATAVVKKVDLKSRLVLKTFVGHTAPVTCIDSTLHLGKTYLVSGSWDKSIRVWNHKGECIQSFSEHSDFIKGVAFAHLNSDLVVYSGSSDRDIRKWKLNEPSSLATLKGHRGPVEDIKVSLDHEFMYSCSSDGSITKWDVKSDTQLMTFTGHLTTVYRMYLTEEDVWSVSADKTVRRFNMVTGTQDTCFHHPDQVRSLVISSDLRYLITGCRDENVYVYDLQTDLLVGKFQGHWDDVTALLFDKTSHSFYSGSLDATLRIWNLKDAGKQLPLDELLAQSKKEPVPVPTPVAQALLTEEEERELAELMLSDEE